MARKAGSREGKTSKSGKVGSTHKAAKGFGGKTDFGVESSRSLGEYSKRKGREAKFRPAGSHLEDPRQERGSTQARRESGVGKSNAGPGANSAGDVDPDVVGVGGGAGLAQGGPDQNVSDAESTTGGSEEFASGPPARGENMGRRGRGRGRAGAGKIARVKGSFVDRSGTDEGTVGTGGSVTNGRGMGEEVTGPGLEQRRRRRRVP